MNLEERSRGTRSWIKDVFEEFEDIQAQRLAIAGVIVEKIRTDIYDKTGFRCSAGIAQNKVKFYIFHKSMENGMRINVFSQR